MFSNKLLRQQLLENDKRWELFNRELIKHSKNGDWGGYRSTLFEMAELLRKEGKLKNSVQIFLEVCYLDLNGPTNGNALKDEELLRQFPAFDPERGSLYYTNIIKKLVIKSGLTKESVRELFITDAEDLAKTLKLPVTPDNAWIQVEKEIF